MTFAIEKRSPVICSPSLVTEESQSQERILQKTEATCDSCPFWEIPTAGFGICFIHAVLYVHGDHHFGLVNNSQ